MICQKCQQANASVVVVDVPADWTPGAQGAAGAQERQLCEFCAQSVGIAPVATKPGAHAILKLLKLTRTPKRDGPHCRECGLTLLEFRQKGRLGCPTCYQAFGSQLQDLLDRVHGATRHVGRVPGLDADALAIIERRSELERELENAIREEAYEQAAELRDQLKSLGEA